MNRTVHLENMARIVIKIVIARITALAIPKLAFVSVHVGGKAKTAPSHVIRATTVSVVRKFVLKLIQGTKPAITSLGNMCAGRVILE